MGNDVMEMGFLQAFNVASDYIRQIIVMYYAQMFDKVEGSNKQVGSDLSPKFWS